MANLTRLQPAVQQSSKSVVELETENLELQLRLQEAEDTIRAIQTGAVDAFVVEGEDGQRVYALESADRPYRLWIEQMQQGTATLLVDGTIAYCNAALADLLKVPQQKLIGMVFWDFISPEDIPSFKNLMEQSQHSRQGAAWLRRPDNDMVRTYLTFNALPQDFGAAIGVLVTDLTTQRHHDHLRSALAERKLAQEQLEKELQDTKLLQDISAQLIQAQDADALYRRILEAAVKLMQASKGTLQLFDASTAELRLIASHAIDPKLHAAFATVTSESGTSCALALRTHKRAIVTDFAQGDYLTSRAGEAHRAAGVLAAQTTPLLTRSGELLGMMSTHWDQPREPGERELRMMDILARQTADLIERMHAEESLRQSETRLEMELADTKLLQSLSAQIIHEESVDNLYEKLTEAAVAIMQSDFSSMQMYYPEPGTPGKLKLLAASGLNEAAKEFWKWVTVETGTTCAVALQSGKRFITSDLQNCEHVIGKPDHALFVAAGVHAAQSTPLYSRNGELLGMISTHWKRHHAPSDRDLRLLDILARQAADLIERKKAEAALKQSKVALTEADRRKDEFLATLAHELRNPLAPIRNGLHIMRMSPHSNKLGELRDMMDRQVTHLVRLIDDLLDVSRVRQGKIDLRKQRITLQSAVEAATEASRPLIEDSKHLLVLDLPEQALWLDADLTRVAQIIGNLLNNAAKYTPEGGLITVTAYSENGYAVLSVSDTGVGIPTEMLPKVFDLFTQVDRNLERSQGGLGIGLALVRQLLDIHGGTIEAHSAGAGQGSTFTVRLPLAPVVEATSPHLQ
jgi:signal transduction histidine kinase/PAS domain-containing protein